MQDIADDLGLSLVTISKAIRNHPDLAKNTRDRVLKRAKEMNYRPNLMARSLVTGRSSLVGLVVPDLIHPYFAEIAKSLSSALREKNLFLIVASSDHDPALEEAEIEQILAHRLDALVVASVQTKPAALRNVLEDGPPLVLFDRSFAGFSCNFVGIDNQLAGQLAGEHLLSTGRQRLAHIRGPNNSVSRARLKGFEDAMAKGRRKGMNHCIILPEPSTDSRIAGEAGMKQLLALRPRPNAVFCYNDAIAIGAMATALQAGLSVPGDIAIIGCGNYSYADVLQVPLSSIDQRIQDMGKSLAEMIFDSLKNDAHSKPRKIVLTPELVVRLSSVEAV